jgi:hypothetical protein
MVVALCAAYSFGEQIGTLRAMLMSGDSFTGGHAMMYRQHKDWDGNSRGEMMLYSDTPTATQAVTPPPITNPTVKTVIKSPVAKK